jgi:PAS domain S-box-containing protein
VSDSTESAAIPLEEVPLHSTNLLTVLDADGVVRYESPSIERIYGYDPATLVGDPVAEYVHPDDRAEVMDAFRTVVESDAYAVEAVEYRHECADGTYLWVESVASADPTPEGYYVVNTRDISDRKERERDLEAMNERLEEFASVVSHDLRNPLNVAQARLQLGREECDSEHFEDVANAHDRMDALIENLLMLSRVGREVSEPEPIALDRLCRNCWGTVVTDDATLVTDADRRLLADRQRLRQLLENLVRNAVEHAPAGVTVTVGTTESGFYVADDGPGIPADERARVFEAGTSSDDGTGLGLNIVEGIADAHDWDVRVTDGTDGGARFEITGVEFAE